MSEQQQKFSNEKMTFDGPDSDMVGAATLCSTDVTPPESYRHVSKQPSIWLKYIHPIAELRFYFPVSQ